MRKKIKNWSAASDFLLGMLTNLGLIVLMGLLGFLGFTWSSIVFFVTYIILSILVYFLSPSKPFKYGYIVGFILGLIENFLILQLSSSLQSF